MQLSVSTALDRFLDAHRVQEAARDKVHAAASLLAQVTGAAIDRPALLVTGERVYRVEPMADGRVMVRLDQGEVFLVDEIEDARLQKIE